MLRISTMALLLAAAAPAMAVTPFNLGFENGLNQWTTNSNSADQVGTTMEYGVFMPVQGSRMAYARSGLGVGTFTTISRTFKLDAGGTIAGSFGFQTGDYMPYNDVGQVSVNGTTLLSYDVATVGTGGNSGWQGFSFTAPTKGFYTVEFGVANILDNGVASGVVIDGLSVTGAVPEPATWAMMILGFGMVGATMRRRAAVAA